MANGLDPDVLGQQAQAATAKATGAIEALPKALIELRGNLNEIFNQDNPLVAKRTGLLENFLSAGDRARAEFLPSGSQGTVFSPTQLQAQVSSRKAASLAPLASINQLLMGQFGNLRGLVTDATALGQGVSQAAQFGATSLQDMWSTALAERARQEQLELARKQADQFQALASEGKFFTFDPNTGEFKQAGEGGADPLGLFPGG